MTAVATTIVGFLPVFAMEGAEGRLFKPLAFTKTFALIASIVVALTLIPPLAHILFTGRINSMILRRVFYGSIAVAGIVLMFVMPWWAGALLLALGVYKLLEPSVPGRVAGWVNEAGTWLIVLLVAVLLAGDWLPLGPERGFALNFIFVTLLVVGGCFC